MKYLLLVLAALLAGCNTVPTTTKVDVVVPVRCQVDPVVKPSMPFDEQAKKSMNIYAKTQLLLAQDLRHKAYENQLEAAVKACTSEPKEPSK